MYARSLAQTGFSSSMDFPPAPRRNSLLMCVWRKRTYGRGTLAGHFNATCPKLPSHDEYAGLIREGGLG